LARFGQGWTQIFLFFLSISRFQKLVRSVHYPCWHDFALNKRWKRMWENYVDVVWDNDHGRVIP
jgi:hypothetical protein